MKFHRKSNFLVQTFFNPRRLSLRMEKDFVSRSVKNSTRKKQSKLTTTNSTLNKNRFDRSVFSLSHTHSFLLRLDFVVGSFVRSFFHLAAVSLQSKYLRKHRHSDVGERHLSTRFFPNDCFFLFSICFFRNKIHSIIFSFRLTGNGFSRYKKTMFDVLESCWYINL